MISPNLTTRSALSLPTRQGPRCTSSRTCSSQTPSSSFASAALRKSVARMQLAGASTKATKNTSERPFKAPACRRNCAEVQQQGLRAVERRGAPLTYGDPTPFRWQPPRGSGVTLAKKRASDSGLGPTTFVFSHCFIIIVDEKLQQIPLF